jgi:hypothetical protein
VVERAEVLHRKLLLERCSGTLEKIWAQGGENDVVDVEQQVRSVDAAAVDEQRGVRLGLHEAQGDQVGEEAVIPCLWRLLQTIEGLVEPAHQLRVCGVNEAGGLRAVDYLEECAVKEGVLDVELVHGPAPGDSQGQHSLDGSRLDDGAEGLVILHPGALSEPRRTQRALYRSRESSALSLCLKIHLSVTTLAPRGRGTKSHVLLDTRASYSSSIA